MFIYVKCVLGDNSAAAADGRGGVLEVGGRGPDLSLPQVALQHPLRLSALQVNIYLFIASYHVLGVCTGVYIIEILWW